MINDKEIVEALSGYLPVVKNWIYNLINNYALSSKRVSEYSFSRLPTYYSRDLLESTKVVVVDKPPMIPLASLGLTQFENFEKMNIGGITYLDTYFVRSDHVHLESVHFHELVHIVQWHYLGIDNFLLLYGLGLLKYKYQDSPLEALVYSLEKEFKENNTPFDVKDAIVPKLDKMKIYLEELTTT